jgi:hypothetical protein
MPGRCFQRAICGPSREGRKTEGPLAIARVARAHCRTGVCFVAQLTSPAARREEVCSRL